MGPPQYFVPGIPGVDTSTLTGGKSLRRQSTIETSGHGKRRRVQLKTTVDRSSGLNVSGAREPDPVYDGHLLANMGPQRLTGLSMKIGKRLGKLNGIERFLQNLQQNGKVSAGWNGRILSDLDSRNVTMHMFRHRLSKNIENTVANPDNELIGNTISTTYPDTAALVPTFNVLFPNTTNESNVYPMNGDIVDQPATGDRINAPFYTHVSGRTYWSPLNRPDLEDMSWNLNKLKLGSEAYVPDSIPPADPIAHDVVFGKNTSLFQIGKHRRQSAIQQNNQKYVDWNSIGPLGDNTGGGPSTGSTIAPYVYDAVLRHGVLSYDFQNKLDTGATVEIILYRVKHNATMPCLQQLYLDFKKLNQTYMSSPTTPPSIPNSGQGPSVQYPLHLLAGQVGRGYLDTVCDQYASDDLVGRRPLVEDVFDNPRYPLLPVLNKTKQAELPFAEVLRNKFTLTAGSRRCVRIELPGEIYDPCNLKSRQQRDPQLSTRTTKFENPGSTTVVPLTYTPPETNVEIWPLKASEIPILDDHSYCAVISVNGQKMTKFFDNPGASAVSLSQAGAVTQFRTDNVVTTPTYIDRSQLMPNGDDAWAVENTAQVFYVASPGGGLPFIFSVILGSDSAPGTPPAGYPDYTGSWPASSDFTVISAGTMFTDAYSGVCRLNSLDGPVAQVLDDVAFGPLAFGVNSLIVTQVSDMIKPNEFPMGDAFGTAHVDYCCTYTEHIGACMYKDTGEKHLYTQGQPDVPTLTLATGSKSTSSARIILPATTAVRQGDQSSWTVDGSGNPSVLNHSNGTSQV